MDTCSGFLILLIAVIVLGTIAGKITGRLTKKRPVSGRPFKYQ